MDNEMKLSSEYIKSKPNLSDTDCDNRWTTKKLWIMTTQLSNKWKITKKQKRTKLLSNMECYNFTRRGQSMTDLFNYDIN